MRDFSVDLVWAKIQMAFAVIGGWLGYFLGGVDGLLIALLVFVVLDYVTGVMCARRLTSLQDVKSALPTDLAAFHAGKLPPDKKLSSEVGFKGLFRKVLIFALVGVAHIIDVNVVGTGSALRSAVICFYLSNEGVSVLENAAHLGLPVPDKLRNILTQLHDRSDKDNTTDKTDTTDKGDGE